MNAKLTNTIDTGYKNGFVRCACGWEKSLGDGFNQHFIDKCPKCSPRDVSLRGQNTVTIGGPGHYEMQHGSFYYFAIENGIHVQFSKIVTGIEYRQRLPR